MRVSFKFLKTHRSFHGNGILRRSVIDHSAFTVKTICVEKSLKKKPKEILVNFDLLTHYYNLHGNLDCEVAFVTPNNDSQWPVHYHGKSSIDNLDICLF